MAKQKHERTGTPKSPLEQEKQEGTTFTEIGGSPMPGLTLRHVLRGHKGVINRIAWSPDGSYLASPSADQTIRIWEAESGESVRTLRGHEGAVYSVAWSPDGQCLASAGDDNIRLWEAASGKHLQTLTGHSGHVRSLAWSPNGQKIVSTSDNKKLIIHSVPKGSISSSTKLLGDGFDVAWSPISNVIAVGIRSQSGKNTDVTLELWNIEKKKPHLGLGGHSHSVFSVAWSPEGNKLASGSLDTTIRLWNTESGQVAQILEGHTDMVNSLTFSRNRGWLASKASDHTVRLWRCDTWGCAAVLEEPATEKYGFPGLAFHPHLSVLATLGEKDTIIRIWDLEEALLLAHAQESVHYTTAKLVLVGDSGVGKTGLGWRLAHGEFKEHSSTHGQQFWPIQQLGLTRADGTDCEAVLWDLAGQHVYRQIHSIFLENVAAALVLFDPSNRQDPLKGAQFWLEQLKGKGQLPPTVLVGARVDRGAPAISQPELDQFCQRYGIRGGYISTSAKSEEGLDTLLETLKAQIPWDEMTATVTTVTFKRIKDFVLALKEKPDRKGVLVSPKELRKQLEAAESFSRTVEKPTADSGQQDGSWVNRLKSVFNTTQEAASEAASSEPWTFTDAEMMTAVGHLETHGYVTVLRSSAGEQHILLTPELLVTLAASIVLLADKHPRELGAVSETELLQGKYPFDELAGLSPAESQVLLDAAILRFLQHNICFRETLGDETLLIFPGLIKQKRPLQDDLPSTDDVSYVVRGRVENLYASLVVLLGYTPSFTRINQWQNQAQYEMDEGQICGFRLIEDREGEIEVVLYYGDRLPTHGRTQFQGLFEQFLYQRDVEVTPFPPVVCPQGHRQERATIIKRVREGKSFVHCAECGQKTDLPDLEKPQTIGIGASLWLQREEAAARLRSAYEVQLTRVKGYRRDWATPRCFVSHLSEQTIWAAELIRDLRDAGVYVVEQAAQVQPEDFVIVLDTADYKRAFKSSSPGLAADAPLVRARLGNEKPRLISLALTGENQAHEFKDCTALSFCDETHYPVSLFNLVLYLYAIPFAHKSFEPLRQTLHEQWEGTLGRFAGENKNLSPKIFISYSHQDEEFKDEFVKMLAGLVRRDVLEVWQDRQIEPGEEWFNAIKKAINECDLALLLVSPDFIDSRFINDEELPDLLKRRQQEGMIVIPIIVRPCMWKSEPVLKDLQALPKDGKAVIKFSKEDGERDQVWEEIATAIEKRAKEKTAS